MVRFIIKTININAKRKNLFTFQYGQIYYYTKKKYEEAITDIYIPIWLDLLF